VGKCQSGAGSWKYQRKVANKIMATCLVTALSGFASLIDGVDIEERCSTSLRRVGLVKETESIRDWPSPSMDGFALLEFSV
jgi:hypothetical protein